MHAELPTNGSSGRSHPAEILTGRRYGQSRDVLVMMPFRSDDLFDRRVQMLEYHRLRYIMEEMVEVRRLGEESCDASASSATTAPMQPSATGLAADGAPAASNEAVVARAKVRYKTNVLRQYAGYFPEQALMEIAEADVLVGMLTSANANVTFEMAVRHVLRDGLILLVDDAIGKLPIYLEGMISIDYKRMRSPEVDKLIRLLAADDRKKIDFDKEQCDPEAMKTLRKSVLAREWELSRNLLHALEKIEQGKFLRPPYFRQLPKYISPQALVESWESHEPLCVIQVDWKKRSGAGFYVLDTETNDLEDGPWVCTGNDAFRELYALQEIPDPNVAPRPLGGLDLIARLRKMQVVDEADLKAFLDDQVVLGAKVFLEGRNVSAGVLLAINDRHEPRYRNRKFLPTVVARSTIGPATGSHRTYLIVMYVPFDVTMESTSA